MSFIPSCICRLSTGTVCGVLCAFASVSATAAPAGEEAAIRHVIQSTWDTPQARVEVEPVVVVGRHAVAGWTQGARGGRALLVLGKEGRWSVAVCAGDALKDAQVLESAGLSGSDARQLSAALARAEEHVPAVRKARFASFDGLVRMDGQAGHAPSAAH